MQNYINTFGDLCDFIFLEGPLESKDKPIKYFVKKGIKPPYKAWIYNNKPAYRTLPDGKVELQMNRAIENYSYVNEAIWYILDHLNK